MHYTRYMSHFSIAMTNYMPCQCTFTQCILFCPLPEIKPPLLFKRVFFCSNIAPNAVDTHLIKCCFGFVWNSRIICAIGDEEI